MTVFLIPNLKKENAVPTALRAAKTLRGAGARVLLSDAVREYFVGMGQEFAEDAKAFELCDVIVTVGGDGTILNAARQSVARTFKRMNDLRSSEQLLSGGGTGYRFNAEGNQIAYRCDVKRVTTINYDRKVIHAALGKLNRQADETSNRIDLCLVTSKVDYTVPFDVNASFAEAFETYLENAKG